MWHFQRVFSAMLGQPLMDYVRRRRLSRAMEALCRHEVTLEVWPRRPPSRPL